MRFARIVFVIGLVAGSLAGGSAAAVDDPATADRLVRESFELLHRSNAAMDGWQELYDRGIAVAERAIELDPQNSDAHYVLFCLLGRKAERLGIATQMFRVGRLRELLDRTIELDPRHAHAWEAKGEMLLRLPRLLGGSKSKGVEALERAATLAPGWAKPRLRLAEYHRDENDHERSQAFAHAALTLARAAGDETIAAEADRLLDPADTSASAP